MRVRGVFVVGLGIVLIAVAACTSGNPASTLVPTIGTPPSTTDTFTGSVAVGGSDVHGFTLTNGGQINVTLTAAGPPSNVVMGLGIGNVVQSLTGVTCSLLTNGTINTAAGTTPQISGTTQAGSYCVAVYDVGNLSAAISYSVTVVHP